MAFPASMLSSEGIKFVLNMELFTATSAASKIVQHHSVEQSDESSNPIRGFCEKVAPSFRYQQANYAQIRTA